MSAIAQDPYKVVGWLHISDKAAREDLIPGAHLHLKLYMPAEEVLPKDITQKIPILYSKDIDCGEISNGPWKDGSLPEFYFFGRTGQPFFATRVPEVPATVAKCHSVSQMKLNTPFCYADTNQVNYHRGLDVQVVAPPNAS